MERPKTTNRNRISTRGKDISLEVFCVGPSPDASKNHDTSVYEIDIQSDFEYSGRGVKTVAIDAESSKEIQDSKKKIKGGKDARNPFIQSYYPNFLESSCEIRDKNSETSKIISVQHLDQKDPGTSKDSMGKDISVRDISVKDSLAKHSIAGKDSSAGRDSVGRHSVGREVTGKDSVGKHISGKDSTAEKDIAGKDSVAKYSVGKEVTKRHSLGKQPSSLGKDSLDKDLTGKESLWKQVIVKDSSGKDITGKDSLWKQIIVKDSSGKEVTVKDSSVKSITVKDSTAKNILGKDSTIESTDYAVKKDSTMENITGKFITRKDSTAKNVTGKDSTAENIAEKFIIRKDSTVKSLSGKDSTMESISRKDSIGKYVAWKDSAVKNTTRKDSLAENIAEKDTIGKKESILENIPDCLEKEITGKVTVGTSNIKPEKDNQDMKFDKYLKNYIIENFFASNGKEMKGLLHEFEGKVESSGVHLHHHEHHHHHYYLDKSLLTESSNDSRLPKITSMKPKRRRQIPEEELVEVENETVEYPHSEVKSDATFTRLNVVCEVKSKDSKVATPKSSVSVESVLNKKSDFIKSHVYSDTDLTKRDSEETADLEELECSGTEMAHGSHSSYTMLVNSLKTFNQFKLPVIITDQKTVPKVSYITCKCSSSDLLNKVSNIVLVNAGKMEKREVDLDRTSDSEESSVQTGINHRMSGNPSKEFRFEIWTSKLKAELREIKKELRKIEERHSKKTKSPFSPFCDGKLSSSSHPKRTRRISVYSSKTFVISPEDVCLNKKRECKRLENGSEFVFDEKRLVLAGSQMNECFTWPGEGTAMDGKRLTEEYSEEYSEECLSKYEQTYSNELYNFSNKIFLG